MKFLSTVCPRNCYSTCSFMVGVENNKVSKIEPHEGNKAIPNGVCIKGTSYLERANSKDRILYPLLRSKSGEYKRISWTDAYALLSEKIKHYQQTYGPQSIFFYAASGMSGMLNDIAGAFWKMIGGATRTYGNLCWPAGLEATRLTLGENKHNAPWDLVNARLIIMWGKNAAETNVQQMIFIEQAQAAGAKLVVIDPRRTQTSANADLYLQISPGTDAILALAIGNYLIEKNKVDASFIEKHVLGFEQYKKHVGSYTLQMAADMTGLPVAKIVELAELIGNTQPMTIAPGYGMQRFTNGGQTIRAILALQVITGNIGKLGATWHYANLQSYVFEDTKEPDSYYPQINASPLIRRGVSMARLGEDMLNIKTPVLKMIWVERGNPVTQNPDTNVVIEAFRTLEFRVVIDQFMTDTAREADLILPAKNMFEQADIVGSYWNPYVQYKAKVVEPAGEVKPETTIYYELALQLGYAKDLVEKYIPQPTDAAIEAYLLHEVKRYPELSLEELKKGPMLANTHEEIAFSDLVFKTPSGKIELYATQAEEKWGANPLPEFVLPVEHPKREGMKYSLQLLTPNTKNRIHSQFGNLKVMQLLDPEPFVQINPQDAAYRNIKQHQYVRVFNERGTFKLKALVDSSILKGCVAISNGWWLTQGGTPNLLSKGRETDMGYGAAFHDVMVEIEIA